VDKKSGPYGIAWRGANAVGSLLGPGDQGKVTEPSLTRTRARYRLGWGGLYTHWDVAGTGQDTHTGTHSNQARMLAKDRRLGRELGWVGRAMLGVGAGEEARGRGWDERGLGAGGERPHAHVYGHAFV
jgi:hypothetical protein